MEGLAISEFFYSIQGEGSNIGVPSVFLRLKGCNLTCGGKNTIKTNQLDSGATWRCDTIEVWLTGKRYLAQELCDIFESQHYIDKLRNGAHLIVTGGEPLLQDKALCCFFESFLTRYKFIPFVEVETNGTFVVSTQLDKFIAQYNVSFKLANSGMDKDNRIIADAINFFLSKDNVIYKFVVSSKDDVVEVVDCFVNPYTLPYSKIYLMPGASSRSKLRDLEPVVIELCKELCVNYSTRLHVHAWDRLTGV
jgi:7-carboxy-7-deazaguanine synthase